MKKYLIILLIVLFPFIGEAAYKQNLACTSLTGGTVGALDYYKVGQLSEGDETHCNVSGEVFHFVFDEDSTDAETTAAHPYKIRPDDYSAQGVWIEQKETYSSTAAHASDHTDGTDDIQDATAAQKGLMTAAFATKLDGIETSATADLTGAEIKSLYEAEDDTNAYTDTEKGKLSGIEALADVTDATNVNAAGATMNTDTNVSGNSWVLDQDGMGGNDDTKVPTQQSVKAYVDAVVSMVEGTEIKSTGEGGGTKFLREDGDGTSSWQTVQTVSSYVFDVEDYGAGTGESAATNTTAFQAAIDAAEAVNGGVVLVGNGTYDLGGKLTIDSDNVTIIGQGWGATILDWQSDLSDDLIHFNTVNGGGVKKLSINSTGGNQSAGAAIHVYHSAKVNIKEVDFSVLEGAAAGALYNGIWFEEIDTSFMDTFIMSVSQNGIQINGEAGFVGGEPKAEMRISNGRVMNCGGIGIKVGGAMGGVYLTNLDVIGNSWGLFQDNSLEAETNREILVINCSFDGNDNSGYIHASAMPNGYVGFTGTWFASNKAFGIQIDSTGATDNVAIVISGGTIFNHLDNSGANADGNAFCDGIYVGNGYPYISISGTSFRLNDGAAINNAAASGRIYISSGTSFFSNGIDGPSSKITYHYIFGTLEAASTTADATNFGLVGRTTGGGTINIGVYAHAAGATTNHPFQDNLGNYSDATAWHDASDPARKALIRDMKNDEVINFYAVLDDIKVQAYRYKAEIPILGYAETAENAVKIARIEEANDKKAGKEWDRKQRSEREDELRGAIFDNPEKAPQRYGVMANELPVFLSSADKKGVSGSRLATYLIVIVQQQKKLIADLTARVEAIEAAQ